MKRRIHLDCLIHSLKAFKTPGWNSSAKYHTYPLSDTHKGLQAVIEATMVHLLALTKILYWRGDIYRYIYITCLFMKYLDAPGITNMRQPAFILGSYVLNFKL